MQTAELVLCRKTHLHGRAVKCELCSWGDSAYGPVALIFEFTTVTAQLKDEWYTTLIERTIKIT